MINDTNDNRLIYWSPKINVIEVKVQKVLCQSGNQSMYERDYGVGGYVIAPDDFTGTLQESYADDAALAANKPGSFLTVGRGLPAQEFYRTA
ncbi:MAG: hypothetical protein MJY91_05590 [Bacteroidales bacterium]|nr:hypothetical protein [Bacteroidales bacterium]